MDENTYIAKTAEEQRLLDEVRYGYAPDPGPAEKRIAARRKVWEERKAAVSR